MRPRNLLLAAAGSAALAGGVLKLRRDQAGAALDRAWRSLEALPAPGGIFTEESVAHLPGPARRYLLHAIAPGTPLSPGMRLSMEGSIKIGDWRSFRAEEILAPPVGFVWRATADFGPLKATGADSYIEGEGRVQFWMFGVIPVAGASGPDVSRAAAGRLLAEVIWAPATLLAPGVRWEAAGDDTARATLDIGGEPMSVTLAIAPDGALRSGSILRWADLGKSGRYEWVPYGCEVEEERRFGGYTLPSRVRVSYGFGTPQVDVGFKGELTGAAPIGG